MRGNATFLRLWIGQTVSGLGSQLTAFGLAVWVFQQSKSVTAMAMIYMAAAIPGIVLSPFLGALVDRMNRKRMMLFADTFAGAFSLMLVCVLSASSLRLWQVYLVAGAGSIANTIMWPTLSATTSLLVAKEHLGRANGLVQFGDAGAMILAPVLGGMIYGFLGLRGLVITDVASFVFALAMTLVSRVPQPAATEEGAKARASLWREVTYGFHFVLARPGMLILLGYFMFVNLVLPISNTLVAPIVLSHWNAKSLGLVQSVAGTGMLVGTALMAAWGGPKRKVDGFWMFGVVCFAASLLLLLPLSVTSLCTSFFAVLVAAPVVNACSQTIWMRKTPADVQGKVFAVRRMAAWFMTPLAFILAGPLADRVFEPNHHPATWLPAVTLGRLGQAPGSGLQAMFVASGVLTLAASLAIFAFPRFRRLEAEIPDAELATA